MVLAIKKYHVSMQLLSLNIHELLQLRIYYHS